jgi:hypothetical protein
VKKVILIVAVAALVLAIVPLALAGTPGGGWKHGKAKFNLVGKVTAVDAENGMVTICVKAGTKSVRSIRYRVLHEAYEMSVAEGAKIVWIGKHGKRKVIDLADVQEGARVKARGTVMWSEDETPVLMVTIKNLKVRQPLPAPTSTE